ncbi:uncharacterized protein SAPINGB_P005800 [Magnusiomyces paraingens]|uniref:Uncharacterized protein n=1 Tax=Magnusiomyces paraingens TaxID=2606893 RepID=A0A5E8C6Y3_9ASCO|nr:uncharacterized protein SAPINGB_P005800 [Saprochaete ingens]VVT57648.1 unnamed protein product [Saprochaete ingens]
MKDSPGIALDRKTRVGTIRHGSNSVWNIAKSPSLKSLRQQQRQDAISPYNRAGSLSRSTSSTAINGFLDESFEAPSNGRIPRSFSELNSLPCTPQLLSPKGSPSRRRRSSIVPSGSFIGLSQLLEDASEGDISTSSIFPKTPFHGSTFRNSSSPLNSSSFNESMVESSSSPQSVLTLEASEQDSNILPASLTPLLMLEQAPLENSLKRKRVDNGEKPSYYGHSRSSSSMSNSKNLPLFSSSVYQQRNKRPKFEVTEREIKSIGNVSQNEQNNGFFTASFDALEAEAKVKKPLLLTYHEPKQAKPIAKVSVEPKSTTSARKLFSNTPSFLTRYTDLRKVGSKFFPLHVKPKNELADVQKKREELLESRRLEAERLRREEEERIFREQERIRLEREERERKEREERERQERLRREQEERERLERERKAREERERKEREENERKEREERERKERELKEKIEREKREKEQQELKEKKRLEEEEKKKLEEKEEEKTKRLEEEGKQKSGEITPQPLDASSSSTPIFTFGASKAPSSDTKDSTEEPKKPAFNFGSNSAFTTETKTDEKDVLPKPLFGSINKPSNDSSKPSSPLFGQGSSALGTTTTQKPLTTGGEPKSLFGTPTSSTPSTPKMEDGFKPKFSFNFNSGANSTNPTTTTTTATSTSATSSSFGSSGINATTAGASGSSTGGFNFNNKNNNVGSSATGFNLNNSTSTGFNFNSGNNAGAFKFNGSNNNNNNNNTTGGFTFNGSSPATPTNNSFNFSSAPAPAVSTFKLSSAPTSFDFNAMSGGNGGAGGFTFGGSNTSAPIFTGGNAFGNNNNAQNGQQQPQTFNFNGPSSQSFVFTGQAEANSSQPPAGRKVLPIRRRIRPN